MHVIKNVLYFLIDYQSWNSFSGVSGMSSFSPEHFIIKLNVILPDFFHLLNSFPYFLIISASNQKIIQPPRVS